MLPVAAAVLILTGCATATTPYNARLTTTTQAPNRDAANAATRIGDVPVTVSIRTDERYNKPGLFSGPRGWAYWNYLEEPKGYQNPNLWPDKRPTYLFGEMTLPAGAELTIKGWYPHARFFNFSIYLFEKSTFVNAPGGSIDGYDIEPDPGSINPYRVGADRNAKDRNFTVRIIARPPGPRRMITTCSALAPGLKPPAWITACRLLISPGMS